LLKPAKCEALQQLIDIEYRPREIIYQSCRFLGHRPYLRVEFQMPSNGKALSQ